MWVLPQDFYVVSRGRKHACLTMQLGGKSNLRVAGGREEGKEGEGGDVVKQYYGDQRKGERETGRVVMTLSISI